MIGVYYEEEEVTEWLMVADCKSVGNTFVGSNPTFFIVFNDYDYDKNK